LRHCQSSAAILYGKLAVVRYRTGRVAARFLHGRVVRAVWVDLERPDRRDKPCVQRLLICTDPALSAPVMISGYAKRWAVESLFRTLKHGFGLKDAWQQSRQVLMRWVTVVAAGYAIPQMLAFTDPAGLAGLAQPAPWRAPGTRTAGLIQAGIVRILREVGRPALIAAIWEKSAPLRQASAGRQRRPAPKPRKSPNAAIVVPVTWLRCGATKKKCRLETTACVYKTRF
jgi:hypothetical protein